jgi:hypothetical protein
VAKTTKMMTEKERMRLEECINLKYKLKSFHTRGLPASIALYMGSFRNDFFSYGTTTLVSGDH